MVGEARVALDRCTTRSLAILGLVGARSWHRTVRAAVQGNRAPVGGVVAAFL